MDATNIERNLYLTMQLLEMDIPMVVAMNMMDEVLGNQGSIDVNTDGSAAWSTGNPDFRSEERRGG